MLGMTSGGVLPRANSLDKLLPLHHLRNRGTPSPVFFTVSLDHSSLTGFTFPMGYPCCGERGDYLVILEFPLRIGQLLLFGYTQVLRVALF
ncbi:MAG TPA: hypothetical protein VLH40_07955, partial [Atribacteraceae bacterium]|nr:hypothetical protein [Atribacteraceae bacterium]